MSEYKPVTAADHLGRFGAGLVGEGCPWESVQQMAVDLGEAVYSYRKALEAVPGPSPDASLDRVARIGAAAALLSSGSNP